jgi:hypothetical protein
VVINPLFLSIHVHEGSDFHAIWRGQQVGSFQVEVLGVEIVRRLKVGNQSVYRRSPSAGTDSASIMLILTVQNALV